ncbi:MAG TPA: hypothetical protein VFA75_10020 [Nevskia sp.]|nr:hypothetical protein [Nevskia sp.]
MPLLAAFYVLVGATAVLIAVAFSAAIYWRLLCGLGAYCLHLLVAAVGAAMVGGGRR